MEHKWWHGKIAYQIYPKSFCDSNGDGFGDLQGIISKLDYLHDLGVELLWISPVYPSPFVDQGYDISDYCNIDPVFGDLATFDRLLSEAKKRNIEIIMDLVLNHCSSEHPWFKKACADLNSEEAGYFYFVKGKDGKKPNNLRSYFGGSVWDKIPGHEQEDIYYSHYFAKAQPDLNWNNPRLREEIFKLVNFWIDRGVRGFRIDAILSIVKDLSFPDLPADSANDGMSHAANMNAKLLDRIGPYLNELKERTFNRADCFTVGEVLTVTKESVKEFAGDHGYFSTLFDLSPREVIESHPHYVEFPTMMPDDYARCVFNTQELYQNTDAFVAPIMENHDEPRGVSYYLPDYLRNATGAKCLGTFLMMLRGIPFIYQGQEIGMTNTEFTSPDDFDDLYAKEEIRYCLECGMSIEESLKIVGRHTRDNARTPVLWDDSANAGFTTGKPWLKVHQDYQHLNVKSQLNDPNSVLNHYKKLIALRKDEALSETFTYGKFERLTLQSGVLAYYRVDDHHKVLIIANTNTTPYSYDLGQDKYFKDGEHTQLKLSANEASLNLEQKSLVLGVGGAAIIQLS